MENKEIIEVKQGIFQKLKQLIKKLFFKKEDKIKVNAPVEIKDKKKNFIENVKNEETEEKQRILALKYQYDNGTIDEEDITNEDIDKLIELYKEETKLLNEDSERRRKHIIEIINNSKTNN